MKFEININRRHNEKEKQLMHTPRRCQEIQIIHRDSTSTLKPESISSWNSNDSCHNSRRHTEIRILWPELNRLELIARHKKMMMQLGKMLFGS